MCLFVIHGKLKKPNKITFGTHSLAVRKLRDRFPDLRTREAKYLLTVRVHDIERKVRTVVVQTQKNKKNNNKN